MYIENFLVHLHVIEFTHSLKSSAFSQFPMKMYNRLTNFTRVTSLEKKHQLLHHFKRKGKRALLSMVTYKSVNAFPLRDYGKFLAIFFIPL